MKPPLTSSPVLPSSRRQFLAGTAVAVAAAMLPGRLLAAEGSASAPAPARNAFVYKFPIGDLEAWSISGGHRLFKEGLNLMCPEADRPAMLQDLVSHRERTDALPLYVNILVVKSGSEIAIFDSGF